ncbi:hypothetical protein KXR87_17280 [Yokenella regensburgei]
MSEKKKSSSAVTIKSKKCVQEVKVTNQFKRMMTKALKATLMVLEKRREDLSTEKWGIEQQKDFFKIFGVRHDVIITIDSEAEKEKVKKLDPETPRDPYIEKKENITAYLFMQKSVDRMIFICEKMSLESRVNSNDIRQGNFINATEKSGASASVSADQTTGLHPDLYGKILTVNIFQNFICKPLTGWNSQVSTLCHEFSHFYRHGSEGEYGGMGTDDIPIDTKDKNETGYLLKANDLVKKNSQYVFKSAYNIERYFELNLTEEEIKIIEDIR